MDEATEEAARLIADGEAATRALGAAAAAGLILRMLPDGWYVTRRERKSLRGPDFIFALRREGEEAVYADPRVFRMTSEWFVAPGMTRSHYSAEEAAGRGVVNLLASLGCRRLNEAAS